MYSGVDISAAQGNVDFPWLKQKGYSFVISRCYVGNDFKDHFYDSNIAKTKDAGMKAAAYHFPYPLPADAAHPNRSPSAQAEMHFTAANGELAACDAEWPAPEDWQKWGCSANQIRDWFLQYLERYEQLSGQIMPFYTYPYFAKAIGFTSDFAKYPLWIASYAATPAIPSPWPDYYMWQTSGGGLLTLPSGIKTDTDVAKDLSWWGITDQTVTPTQTPEVSTTSQSTTVVATATQTPNMAQQIIDVALQIIKTIFHIS